jgi:hypothetical protein
VHLETNLFFLLRYNKKLSPQQNINLPASLLSRFDLLFLLLDKASPEKDRSLAEHITYVGVFFLGSVVYISIVI